MNSGGHRAGIWGAPLVCLMVLVAGGALHRWLGDTMASAPLFVLDPPLAKLPSEIGSWRGTDVPLDDRVIEVAGSDDQVYRRYVNEDTAEIVDLYVAYASRPANMLGHRPEICYPSQGWVLTSAAPGRIALADGGRLDCNVQTFSRSRTTWEGVAVLNYYILQGDHTADWRDFWGPRWRLPNLSQDRSFYVVSVIVSSVGAAPSRLEPAVGSIKRFTGAVAPLIAGVLESNGVLRRKQPG